MDGKVFMGGAGMVPFLEAVKDGPMGNYLVMTDTPQMYDRMVGLMPTFALKYGGDVELDRKRRIILYDGKPIIVSTGGLGKGLTICAVLIHGDFGWRLDRVEELRQEAMKIIPLAGGITPP